MPGSLANVVNLDVTYAVYLGVALPLAALLFLLLRRPIAAAVVGSVLAMVLTSVFKEYLPFDYWAHANDCIIEPLAPFLRNATFKPIEAAASLLFHVGVPAGIVWLLSTTLRRKRKTADTRADKQTGR